MTESDIIIIGAGPGGYETAARAAASGKRVTVIERDAPGGTCLNRGCIPTKALCASAETIETVRSAGEFGIAVAEPKVDFPAVMARKNDIVGQLRQGVEGALRAVNVVKGNAIITSDRTVRVGDEEYTAPQVIIATGSVPAVPPIPGVELALTSDGLLELTTLPESLVIIGGGVIGMEFATIFNSFGSKVTVIEFCREIIPALDAEVAKRLRTAMRKRGIDIITQAAVTAITKSDDGLTVAYTEKGKERTVDAAAVAIATGRRACLPDGFTEAGGSLDSRGFIATDESFSTTIPGFYAIGDVNGRCLLAHAATAQGLRLLGEEVNTSVTPSAVFTRPECAAVGLTEERCKELEILCKIGKSTFRANGKAVASGETEGIVKIIVHADSDLILGAHIFGPHASDLMQEIVVAMSAGLPAAAIRSTIHSHPTLSETIISALPA